MKKYFYLLSLLAVVLANTSCRKHSNAATTLQLVQDSVFLYSQEDYLWYDALPTYDAFNPRQFSDQTDEYTLQDEVDAISQYKINPATGKPYEYNYSYPGEAKYSFIDNGQVATLLSGNNGDFGFYPAYGPLSYTDLRVQYVNPNSPAAAAHMHRGDLITAITGVTSLDGSSQTNINAIVNALNANTITMTLQHSNGTSYTVNLTVASYTTNPVMKDTVFTTTNSHKVGYMVFSQFTDLTNAQPYLDAAFSYFSGQNITDLVVDLRYNGGGSVETAEYLDNLIVPTAKTGTTMYTAYYNTKLQNDQYPLLATQYQINKGDFLPINNTSYFKKTNSLNISRVIFIVTDNTASASELTINNLIPEMNVQLVGTTTYGKPVGFFAIPINIYSLYIPEFYVLNSANNGGYYTGMTPGSTTYPGYFSSDDVDHDFGNPSENLLARALSYISTGTFSVPQQQVESTTSASTLSVTQLSAMNSKFKKLKAPFMPMVAKTKLKRKL
jgi:C-terminal processing protease CtpA/Prc